MIIHGSKYVLFYSTGVANNNCSVDVGNDDSNAEFRRQHFDRSSILRHSKKRKKSSAGSNPASVNGTPVKPLTVNGSTIQTPAPEETPVRTSAPIATPTPTPVQLNSTTPVLVPTKLDFDGPEMNQDDQDEVPPVTSEIMDVDQELDEPAAAVDDVIIEEVKADEQLQIQPQQLTSSASSRVAALLAGPVVPSEPAKPDTPPPQAAAPIVPAFEPPTPEFLSEAGSIPALDEIPADALIEDISPLPTPPPTPPPSEIPSVIPEPTPTTPFTAPPPTMTASTTTVTNGVNGTKKVIVVTSTPLAKQMLSQQKSGIPTPMRPTPSPAPATPTASSTITPSRIPKLASGSSIPTSGTHQKLVKSPSSGSGTGTGIGTGSANGARPTSIPGSAGKGLGPRPTPTANGQGRLVLRTRRQAELEDQQRNGFDKSGVGNDDNEENCGRLI